MYRCRYAATLRCIYIAVGFACLRVAAGLPLGVRVDGWRGGTPGYIGEYACIYAWMGRGEGTGGID